MTDVTVIGIRCGRSFDEIMEHFLGMGGDAILMDPEQVCGRDHILSAVMHAERAFERNSNRSRTLPTETILYAAGERQISKALAKMRPKDGCNEMVAAVFGLEDLRLENIDAVADDMILRCTEEKIRGLGLNVFSGIPCEDLVLEMVAAMDMQKH